MRFYLLLFVLSFMVASCVPPTDSPVTEINFDLKSPVWQRLLSYQDRSLSDSIYPFFHHPSARLRYQAVMAFSSMQNTKAIDSLLPMLNDPIIEVRAATAYALGQIGDQKAESPLIEAFKAKDTIYINNAFNQNILEALGKCGSKNTAKMIASVISYRNTDTLLLLGQMRSLFRFGLRNIITEEGTSTAIRYVRSEDYPGSVRILAANYLARFNNVNLANHVSSLISVLENDKNVYVRMALATAIGKTGSVDVSSRMKNVLIKENDYRVKCNLLQQLGNFGYIDNVSTALKFLNDKNEHVAVCASLFLLKFGNPDDVSLYKESLKSSTFWNARSNVYASFMKNTALSNTKLKNHCKDEIVARLKASPNEYEKASLVLALGNDPFQYQTIIELYASFKSSATKTATVEALGTIIKHPEFNKAFGINQYKVMRAIVQFLKVECMTGDVGIIASSASLFNNNTAIPKELLRDSVWIKESLAKLTLPKDIEAYNELKTCEAYLAGTNYIKVPVAYNHPIQWQTLLPLTDSSAVVIKTNKGNIRIVLNVQQAPGSVANFIQLCSDDFFDGKVFHRVVPNFVVQAGCPRGDGYGSLNYTIRSEFSNQYYDGEGYVGMASAGPHTEGTQFFITHCPTPHLDGKYTIFGRVVEGMDVVHALQIGDKIIDAILTVNKSDTKL